MIRHIVFWKFRPDADPEPFLQALSALPEQIDWIRGMHVARSAAPNAAWDAALEVDFDTLEDVARYRDDPRHKKVSALCKSIRTDPIACKRELAYIPDNPDLYDYMTGIRYLNFIADIFGVSSEVRGQRIHDYAARFELTDDLAQPIAAYSHGMKQKLAIISAWLHQPRLIIMDEPFVGLDPKASHLLKGMMREFCDAGGAIFFSTHVLEVAEKLCDKVAIIRGGKLIRSGTMEEVKGDDSLEEVFLELEGESC
jgi:ABC-2 type transport system ATP-binding protein